MTNEEIARIVGYKMAQIRREVARHRDHLLPTEERDVFDLRVVEMVQRFVTQAYEEAAQYCEESAVDIGCTAIEAEGVVRRAREALAADIRGLKRSLVQEPASSVS